MKAAIVLSLALAGLGLAVPTTPDAEFGVEASNPKCIGACKAKNELCKRLGKPSLTCLKEYEECKCTCKGKKYDPKKVGQGDKACY